MFVLGIGMVFCCFSLQAKSGGIVDHPAITASGRIQASSLFNATAAWEGDKVRVEATPMNIEIWNVSTTMYNGNTYNITELSYETPNWRDAMPTTWRINGTLFTPANASGDLGLMPGIVLFHGNGGRRQGNYNYALSFVELNCTALCVDHVGQGDSEGPVSTMENNLVAGDFNKTSYFYLIFCNGIQAVRVLRSFTSIVDVNRIGVSGFSLGGWTSEVISAIYKDKITLSIPRGCVVGIINSSAESSFFTNLNMTYQQFMDYHQTHPGVFDFIDPIHYINMADYPDTAIIMGTNDEYFNYTGINETYNFIPNTSQHKWLQIVANGHHVAYGDQMPQYLVSYKFFGGPVPPAIDIVRREKVNAGAFEQLRVQVNITCTVNAKYVEICYRSKDIFADPWHTVNITKVEGGADSWVGTIDAAWLTSELEYFAKVTLNTTTGKVWFTSPIMTAGVMNNYIAFLPVSGIVAAIALPVLLVLWDRYKVEVKGVDEKKRRAARLHFIIENAAIGASEFGVFGSIGLIWYYISRTQPWSLAYMMQAYFTYEQMLKGAAFYLSTLIFVYLIACGVTGAINPLVSGILNTLWPILFYVMTAAIGASFGTRADPSSLGPGFSLCLVMAIAQVGIWIWKRIYHKRFAIPKRNLVILIKEAANARGKKSTNP